MDRASFYSHLRKLATSQATTQADNIAGMKLVFIKAKEASFYYREDNTPFRISAVVNPSKDKEGFTLTMRTYQLEPGKTPGKNVLNSKAAFDYPIKDINSYHAETALYLGLNPAHLVTKPASVGEYLQGFDADNTLLHLYEDLGASPEDAAKAILMHQRAAESGQGDAQASTDYLADMQGYEFTMNDGSFSL